MEQIKVQFLTENLELILNQTKNVIEIMDT